MSEELVEQIARALEETGINFDDWCGAGKPFSSIVRPFIIAARIEGARLGIEAAAKLAAFNSFTTGAANPYSNVVPGALSQIANAIRSIDPAQIAGGSDDL